LVDLPEFELCYINTVGELQEILYSDKAKGMLVEIANQIFLKLKMNKIVYKELPWSRCITSSKKGSIDAILFIFRKPEREKFLYYYDDNLISHEINSLYTLKENPIKYTGLIEQELKPYTIGVVKDFSYGSSFDNVVDKLKVDTANNVELVIKKLLKKRTDVIRIIFF